MNRMNLISLAHMPRLNSLLTVKAERELIGLLWIDSLQASRFNVTIVVIGVPSVYMRTARCLTCEPAPGSTAIIAAAIDAC